MSKSPLIFFFIFCSFYCNAQHSVAREWNEMTLFGIRNDLAKPVVHARNLYHISLAMYDAWAVFDRVSQPYLLGNIQNDFHAPFEGFSTNKDIEIARHEAISYAACKLLKHRFLYTSPIVLEAIDSLMNSFGYDPSFTGVDYSGGDPAALGNYIAEMVIAYGLADGANEAYDYRNEYYTPINEPLTPELPGNPDIVDPNRWQPLNIGKFIDQSGNEVPGGATTFIGPEWGNVTPFSLTGDIKKEYERDDHKYLVYMDPNAPPLLDLTNNTNPANNLYKWNFELVSIWSAHLDPTNGIMLDISPASKGNISNYPTELSAHEHFFQLFKGGTKDVGHEVNPFTGKPYEPQIVPLGDYARVLAEFWADGPDSETPPGHWFVILNYVSDHPALVKKLMGGGELLNDLEWDIKSYFVLGGAMHDAAVVAWGIKGWYDYVRPISAIRYLADQGQCSDPDLPNYHPGGIRLYKGYIEIVEEEDSLATIDPANIGKIKIKAWRGPGFIEDPATDFAGVGWILAENWWPYQRPTFVTPPFAGYISGHSTFSRTAAEILTKLTGSEFFPGGLGTFPAKKDEFLVFEKGPSQDIVLQWATYQDASDETSLSRIWGGIHPPADDIPGRLIGMQLANKVFEKAIRYMEGSVLSTTQNDEVATISIFPNPFFSLENSLTIVLPTIADRDRNITFNLIDSGGKEVTKGILKDKGANSYYIDLPHHLTAGVYLITIKDNTTTYKTRLKVH